MKLKRMGGFKRKSIKVVPLRRSELTYFLEFKNSTFEGLPLSCTVSVVCVDFDCDLT